MKIPKNIHPYDLNSLWVDCIRALVDAGRTERELKYALSYHVQQALRLKTEREKIAA
jgi:hypothetical protein